MELRHIYSIATSLNNLFNTDELVGADINDATIAIKVSPGTLFGIDQEFYRQTNNGSLEGFVHRKEIDATIANVHCFLTEKWRVLNFRTRFLLTETSYIYSLPILSFFQSHSISKLTWSHLFSP